MGAVDQIISSDESDDESKESRQHGAAGTARIDLKSKMENDPNAPRKPVSAYALFFGDTQAAIKSQNPNASFAEISTIVASMWDVLAHEHKEVYRKKSEDAKKEYRRLKSIYRANLLARASQMNVTDNGTEPGPRGVDTSSASETAQTSSSTVDTTRVEPSSEVQNNINPPPSTAPNSNNSSQQPCIRTNCTNFAIVSPDWEDEYCSNECVVSHCVEIFTRWVSENSATESFVPTPITS